MGHGAAMPHPVTPPLPPTVPDAAEHVVPAASAEHHFPGKGFELVETVGPGGEIAWRVVLQRSAAKPEPVRDESAQDG